MVNTLHAPEWSLVTVVENGDTLIASAAYGVAWPSTSTTKL